MAGVDELGAARFRPRPKGAAGRREGLAVGSAAAAAVVVVVIAAEVVLLAVLTSLDSLVLELKLTLTSYSSIPVNLSNCQTDAVRYLGKDHCISADHWLKTILLEVMNYINYSIYNFCRNTKAKHSLNLKLLFCTSKIEENSKSFIPATCIAHIHEHWLIKPWAPAWQYFCTN